MVPVSMKLAIVTATLFIFKLPFTKYMYRDAAFILSIKIHPPVPSNVMVPVPPITLPFVVMVCPKLDDLNVTIPGLKLIFGCNVKEPKTERGFE